MTSRITTAEAAMQVPASTLGYLSDLERQEAILAQARAMQAAVIMDGIAAMFRGIGALFGRRRTEDELHALSDRTLADIGVNRSEIPEIAARSFPGAANDGAETRRAA